MVFYFGLQFYYFSSSLAPNDSARHIESTVLPISDDTVLKPSSKPSFGHEKKPGIPPESKPALDEETVNLQKTDSNNSNQPHGTSSNSNQPGPPSLSHEKPIDMSHINPNAIHENPDHNGLSNPENPSNFQENANNDPLSHDNHNVDGPNPPNTRMYPQMKDPALPRGALDQNAPVSEDTPEKK